MLILRLKGLTLPFTKIYYYHCMRQLIIKTCQCKLVVPLANITDMHGIQEH